VPVVTTSVSLTETFLGPLPRGFDSPVVKVVMRLTLLASCDLAWAPVVQLLQRFS